MLPTTGHRPGHSGPATPAVPHDVRQMAAAWSSRNLDLVDEHELRTLEGRLNRYANYLPHSYTANRLHIRLQTELQRRGLPLTINK